MAFLLGVSRKSAATLPTEWKNAPQLTHFRRGITLLFIYLSLILTGESIAIYLALCHIYNSFVISINLSLATTFLFGFFYLHTTNTWKRYAYFTLYLFLPGYFIAGGYFHPRSILGGTSILAVYIPYFLASLIFLVHLLLNPKNTYFKFHLKVVLSVQFYSLITLIITSFNWYSMDHSDQLPSYLVYYIEYSNNLLYYSSLAFIFVWEAVKLRRNRTTLPGK